ncbi:hypothetical protein Sjap_008463 [Stephania japonica]|uniref:Uncharacterized protein n=1 Tax=Stephania japonica TaxID=461633 RepID=A0AAP0JQ77_9MAGN
MIDMPFQYYLILNKLNTINAAIIGPIAVIIVLIGNSTIIFGLWPAHFIWTCHCTKAYVTIRFGARYCHINDDESGSNRTQTHGILRPTPQPRQPLRAWVRNADSVLPILRANPRIPVYCCVTSTNRRRGKSMHASLGSWQVSEAFAKACVV